MAATDINMDPLTELTCQLFSHHCWNRCSRNYEIRSILSYLYQLQNYVIFTSCPSSQVYDEDTKYHNLSTKTLDLKDQAFIGEANCILSEDNHLLIECFDFNSNDNHTLIGKLSISHTNPMHIFLMKGDDLVEETRPWNESQVVASP